MSYYKNIFKNLPLSCILFEKREDVFIIREANSYYCKVTNIDGKDLRGKVIEEVFPENPFASGLKEVIESLEIAYSTRETHKIDVLRYDLYDKENNIYELKYWETENIPIFDEAKNIWYILNVVKDITYEVLEKDRVNSLQLKLDDNTEKHELFIERISDGLFSLDREGNFVNLNKGLIEIAETPEDEMLKMNFLPFCGPEHRDEIIDKFNKAIGGINQKFEANFISGKGTKKILEISIVPLKNDGIVTGLYGIAKDITRLKESEVAVIRNERKFKALVQEGSDLIGILDLEGKYKFVSETSSSLLGMNPMEFVGKSAFDFIHPEDQERVITAFSELEFKNQIQIKPFRFKNAKGEWRWVETKATNLINDPAIEGIVTNSRDVTDHINSQKAIKESEERYRSFFENSTDAVLVTIPDGKILAANPSACKMFQRSEEELCLLGQSAFTDVLDPRVAMALKLRRETGTATAEFTLIRKDGTQFPGEVTSSIFKDSEGNSRSSMIIRDITEKEAALQKLKEKTEQLLTAQKIAKLGYWTRKLENDNLFWSDQIFKIWERDNITFQPNVISFEETIHPEDLQTYKEANALAINGEKELDFEYRIILPNGKIKWVHEKGKLNKTNNPEVVFEGTVQDITERRNNLEKLVKSEARFRGLIQSQTNYVIRTDLEGRYTYGNKKFRDDFGWLHAQQEIVGQYSMVSIKEYHHSRVLEAIEKCLLNPDQVFQVEIDKPAKGGGVKTTLWDFIYLKGTAIEPDEIQCVGIDITEKKKLEELLDEASRFARIGSFEVDCKKNTKYWSPVIKEIHEVEIDYVPTLELGFLFFKEGDSRNAISNAYLKALEENIPYDLELQIVTAKGKERWVRKIGRPTFVDGKCVRINGSFQDITNIKNSELKALKASEEKEIILESIGDAFCMYDNDWMVTYWNRHSETLLECSKEKILGKNVWEVFPDAIDTKFYTSYQKAVKDQTIENFEAYFERVHKWFEVTAYPSQSGLSVYFKDITERKETELQIIGLNNNLKAHTEELVEANKGLEQFSFIVSHNLRSPVANILGLADLIGNEGYTQEVKNNFLKALVDNVQRLDIVISDLNAILQIKVGLEAKKEPVLLNLLVNNIKTSIQNLIEKEEVQITTHFEVLSLHTVQSYLYSIFYNLIANSIKYRRPGISPQIGIRSEMKQENIVITFEDNGLGIDLVKKGDQVFGLYRRFHHHIEGKGMGLFLVKTQVELLGGKIAIESEINTGTKFTITFKETTF